MKVNIKRDFYTLATVSDTSAELTMYGEIVETRPVDFWTGEPIEGNYIIQDEFLGDLAQIEGCENLLIRMNSGGGDAAVSITIHNRLREMARNGMKVTCIVDGIAMSGGSLIMCAADEVQVNPSSLIMIHKCWSLFLGAYNADELRKMADANDAYDKAQASIYARKTGMEESKILDMMAETTYLTGLDAVNFGFADILLENDEAPAVAASADRRSLLVHGRKVHLAPGMMIPEEIPTATPEVEATPAPVVHNTKLPDTTGEGGRAMTLEELRQEHPELVSEIEASVAHDTAVYAERQRLQEIDQIAGLFADDLVQEAKYGEHPCTAQELSYRAAQRASQQGTAFLTNLMADANASGANSVEAVPPADDTVPQSEAEKHAEAAVAVRAALGKEEN